MQGVDFNKGYHVTWLVRRLFRAMSERADRYLKDSGLTAADRAVMEFLYPDRALSVPEVARRYQVSRQHVQVTVNGLVTAGLVSTRDNPRHRRSPLVTLTEAGRERFRVIRESEKTLVESLFRDIDPGALEATDRTLQHLLTRLTEEKSDA